MVEAVLDKKQGENSRGSGCQRRSTLGDAGLSVRLLALNENLA